MSKLIVSVSKLKFVLSRNVKNGVQDLTVNKDDLRRVVAAAEAFEDVRRTEKAVRAYIEAEVI